MKHEQEQADKPNNQHQQHNVSAPAKVVYRNEDFVSRTHRTSIPDPSQVSGHSGNSGGTASSSRRVRPLTAYDILLNSNNSYGVGKADDGTYR